MPFTSNPALATLPPSADWQGSPVDGKGRFMNLQNPYVPSLLKVLWWKMHTNPFKAEKRLPYTPAIDHDTSWLQGEKDVIVWLGHCSFFFRLNKVSFVTDPVFWDILLTKRVAPFPIDPDLLKSIDYILLSHDHRDHCDKPSLQLITDNNPRIKVLSGLRMDTLLKEFKVQAPVITAGWYQQYDTGTANDVAICFVPARHWSKRGPFDDNQRLWGGFVIRWGQRQLYFSGDSGYDTHYAIAAKIFGKFDYALLGVGAFEPQWFMHNFHQSPEEALRAYHDLKAHYLVPMHYGTFDLSDEPLSLPLRQLSYLTKKQQLSQSLLTPRIGEAVYL